MGLPQSLSVFSMWACKSPLGQLLTYKCASSPLSFFWLSVILPKHYLKQDHWMKKELLDFYILVFLMQDTGSQFNCFINMVGVLNNTLLPRRVPDKICCWRKVLQNNRKERLSLLPTVRCLFLHACNPQSVQLRLVIIPSALYDWI